MGHTYSCLFFHLVWGTKNRHPFIFPGRESLLYSRIHTVVSREEINMLAIGGTHDHIHLLIKMDEFEKISDLVRKIKSMSAKFINNIACNVDFFAWQPGYSVFTVSPWMIDKIINYINNQKEHHKNLTEEEELKLLAGLK
jgi:REP element-mobilizing transposase RayT